MKMAESESSLPANCRQKLDEYLDAIELAVLQTTATRESRRSVIDMVEAQVIEMCCSKLTEESSAAEVARLFDDLDRPSLYAEAFDKRETGPAPKRRRAKQTSGVSHYAIASVILLAAPFPFLLAALSSADVIPLFYITAFFGWIAAPILSWRALQSIDGSKGRITGRFLATMSLYVVPLILANSLVWVIGLILDGLAIVICIAATMGAFNAGAVWLIRYVLDRWFQSESNGISPPDEVPMSAGTAVG